MLSNIKIQDAYGMLSLFDILFSYIHVYIWHFHEAINMWYSQNMFIYTNIPENVVICYNYMLIWFIFDHLHKFFV